MGRKERVAKARVDVPIYPPQIHRLMTGRWPTERLHGWVESALGGSPAGDDALMWAAWAAHKDALIEEAAEYGFVPCACNPDAPAPRGEAVERWRKAFIRRHEY